MLRKREEKVMEIINHQVEEIEDPFGILTGKRYEIYLNIKVPEEDELFSEKGLKIRLLYIVNEKGMQMSHYHIMENMTEQVLDFELDEDEYQQIDTYCKELIEDL